MWLLTILYKPRINDPIVAFLLKDIANRLLSAELRILLNKNGCPFR